MKILVFGNSGSGKSTYARALAARHGLAHLDLDTIVWEPDQVAVPRSHAEKIALLEAFMSGNAAWVIEGCYGDLIQAATAHCTQLVFLNPGVEACLANNRRRPWEPHKHDSLAQQDAMLAGLQAWVSGYHARDDACSYRVHRRVFDGFAGAKIEHVDASTYAT